MSNHFAEKSLESWPPRQLRFAALVHFLFALAEICWDVFVGILIIYTIIAMTWRIGFDQARRTFLHRCVGVMGMRAFGRHGHDTASKTSEVPSIEDTRRTSCKLDTTSHLSSGLQPQNPCCNLNSHDTGAQPVIRFSELRTAEKSRPGKIFHNVECFSLQQSYEVQDGAHCANIWQGAFCRRTLR